VLILPVLIPNWGFIPTATIQQKNPSRPTVFTKTENSGPRKNVGKIIGKTGANIVGGNIPKFEETGANAPYPSQIYGIS
jgi:hypothetical protein